MAPAAICCICIIIAAICSGGGIGKPAAASGMASIGKGGGGINGIGCPMMLSSECVNLQLEPREQ